jgi:hypothetical protein
LNHLLAGKTAIEVIAIRQETSFPRNFSDVSGKDIVVQETRNDLLGCEAFGNRELVLYHPAIDNGLDDVTQACLLGEKVFASLEVGSGIERKHGRDEYQPMLFDDPFAIE